MTSNNEKHTEKEFNLDLNSSKIVPVNTSSLPNSEGLSGVNSPNLNGDSYIDTSNALEEDTSLLRLKSSSFSTMGSNDDQADRQFGSYNSSRNGRSRRKSRYSYSAALKLKQKKFGLLSCVRILIGCTIGSGIFTSPTNIVHTVNNDAISLCVWFVYGLIALLGSLCFVELGTTFPVSSGEYAYLHEILGSSWGFLYQWSSGLVFVPMVNAVMAETIARYLVAPYFLQLDHADDKQNSICVHAVTTVIIMLLSYAICTNPDSVDKFQTGTFYVKFLLIGTIIVCGFTNLAQNGVYKHTNFSLTARNYLNKNGTIITKEKPLVFLSNMILALYQASYSYLGVNCLTYITEELRDPIRLLPLAALISVPSIITIYLIINILYFTALPPSVINDTEIIASDLIQSVLPTSIKDYTDYIVPTFVAISVIGSLSIHITACARVAFVGGRHHHVPQVLTIIQLNNHSPSAAIISTGLISCIYFWLIEDRILMELAAHLEQAGIAVTIYALIYMRITRPELQRPFKLPLMLPILYAIIATLLFLVPYIVLAQDLITGDDNDRIEDLLLMSGGFIVALAGLPVYFIFVRPKQPPKWAKKLDTTLLIAAQKLLIAGSERK